MSSCQLTVPWSFPYPMFFVNPWRLVFSGMVCSGAPLPCLPTIMRQNPKTWDSDFLLTGGLCPTCISLLFGCPCLGLDCFSASSAVLKCSMSSSAHGFRCGGSAQSVMAHSYAMLFSNVKPLLIILIEFFCLLWSLEPFLLIHTELSAESVRTSTLMTYDK